MAFAPDRGAVNIHATGVLARYLLALPHCSKLSQQSCTPLTFITQVQALDRHLGTADEALLSTAFSWMRKAADDKQDGKFLPGEIQNRHSCRVSAH